MFGASTFGTLAYGVGAGDEEAPPADHIATGVLLTQYGTPSYFVPNSATGVSLTQAGTPRAANTFRASGALVTRYGSHFHPHYQFGLAAGVQVTQAGVPYGWANPLHPGDTWTVTARGVHLTKAGTPEAVSHALVDVAGVSLTRAGQPRAAQVAFALGSMGVAYGLPELTTVHRAPGVRLAQAGQPTGAVRGHAVGVLLARAGKPRHIESRNNRAYGANVARYGRPRARTVFDAHQASGVLALAAGTPAAGNVHRAFALPTVTRAGQPIVLRTPSC